MNIDTFTDDEIDMWENALDRWFEMHPDDPGSARRGGKRDGRVGGTPTRQERCLLIRVELSYFEDCPHWRAAEANLLALKSEFGFELEYRIIDSPESAVASGFRGSPSISVNGGDLFGAPDQAVGFTCRRYETPEGPAGCPTIGQLRRALAAACPASP
ncbi:MAG: hypothetical protein WHS89_12710 [Acidimicrobiales bacterium]